LLVEKGAGTLRYLVEVEELFCLMKLKNKLMELPVFTHQMMVVLWVYKE
jgi:hypothetical protein